MSDWKTWLHGLIAAFIGSAAASLSSMLVAPETFNLTTGTGFRKLALASGLSGIVAAAAYLKTSPLPPPTTLKQASQTLKPDGTIINEQTTATVPQEKTQ